MRLTKEELYWIERTADIESGMILRKFFEIVAVPLDRFSEKELDAVKKMTSELIDSYLILKELRIKCENERNKK